MTAIDLPGFGKTPPSTSSSLDDLVEGIYNQIDEHRKTESVVVIGHSLGGDIGTLLAYRYPDLLSGFINVEGNLTDADTFISKKAALTQNFDQWFAQFKIEIAELISEGKVPESYIRSLNQCDPQAFHNLAQDVIEISGNELGRTYESLPLKKSFWYGTSSLSQESLDFAKKAQLATVPYQGAHHWPMADTPDQFIENIHKFLDD